ncbi:MAG: hypothetical protein ACI4SI_06840 [Candidatus Ornithospirochaeta sp.]
MKRILTLFLIFTFVLCSSFAAGQLYTMAFDSGWNNAIDGPYMGFHMLYHYGASVSENTTVGCGSLIDVDFGLKRFSKGDYIADIAMGFGPSFATDVNVNLTINGMIGPLFDIQKDKITDDSALGIGVGGTFALTLVPTEERKTTHRSPEALLKRAWRGGSSEESRTWKKGEAFLVSLAQNGQAPQVW